MLSKKRVYLDTNIIINTLFEGTPGAESISELLGEIGILKLLEGSSKEIGDLVHPHPTISEALKESSLGALGSAIHI